MTKKNIFDQFFNRLGLVVDWKLIDDLVVSDANILRPIKGHAFEIIFDILAKNYFDINPKSGIGDSDTDRTITNKEGKKITLQIKTCALNTIQKNVRFAISLHKTHGLERRPNNLYPMKWPCPICPHEGEAFPDFLIIQHPRKGILVVPKKEIPESNTYPGHYADPAYFSWNSKWLNRWDLLGFSKFKGKSLERRSVPRQKKLPKLAKIIHLTDEEIVAMWLRPENFRTIDMNLKGNLREPALEKYLKENNIKTKKPDVPYPKYDRKTLNGIKIQIKGPSKAYSKKEENTLGVEVMGTHGKGAIRCYSEKDFDFLGFVIDPQYLNRNLGLNLLYYHFCFIPIEFLPLHYKNKIWRTKDKIYPICKFVVKKKSDGVYLIPSDNYRVKIKFRNSGPWYLDKIPKELNQ